MIDLQRPLLNTPGGHAGPTARPSSSITSWLWTKRWFLGALLATAVISIILLQDPAERYGTSAAMISLGTERLLALESDGLARPIQASAGGLGEHPLLELVQRGRDMADKHDAIRAGVISLEDAIRDYKAAFGIDPPEGFDHWHAFNAEVGANPAASLIPLAVESVQPYLAMPPRLLRQRAGELLEFTGMMAFEFRPDEGGQGCTMDMLSVDPVSKFRHFAQDYPTLLEPILKYLPPPQNGPMLLKTWTEDNSFRIPSGDILEKSRDMARKGEVWGEEELRQAEAQAHGLLGWGNACATPVSAATANQSMYTARDEAESGPSWISDPVAYMDHCKHPEHLLQNGEMIMKAEMPVRRWEPMMAASRPHRGSEILGAPTRSTMDIFEDEIPWKDKNDNRLMFRGAPTGVFHTKLWDWRSSQRDRLADFGSEAKAHGKTSRVLVHTLQHQWANQHLNREELVTQYLDVGLVPKDIGWNCGRWSGFVMCGRNGNETVPNCPGDYFACLEMLDEHEWKPKMSHKESLRYKYHLDVDGYGWTTRFRRELATGSVVLKATLYHEWWSAQLIPWYHYVPIRYDYADVFDTMAFFTGSPGDHRRKRGRDDLAREVASNGRAFALQRMRQVDSVPCTIADRSDGKTCSRICCLCCWK